MPPDKFPERALRIDDSAPAPGRLTRGARFSVPAVAGGRRVLRFVGVLASFHLVGYVAPGAPKDGMCTAFRSFAESIPLSERRSVTLLTDWGAEPTIACERVNKPPDVALCKYLTNNSSIELMGINIKRALECVGARFPGDPNKLYVETIAGTIRSQGSGFTRRHVEVELDFNSAAGEALPHLTIAMTAEAGGK